jgi:hypothetical protein
MWNSTLRVEFVVHGGYDRASLQVLSEFRIGSLCIETSEIIVRTVEAILLREVNKTSVNPPSDMTPEFQTTFWTRLTARIISYDTTPHHS